MRRFGMTALSSQEGIALFDAALGADEAVLAPAHLDIAPLRSRPDGIPAVLRGLVRASSRRAAKAGMGSADALRQRQRASPERQASDPSCRRLPGPLAGWQLS